MSKLDLHVWKFKPSGGGQSAGVETPISYPSDAAGSGTSSGSQSKKNEQYVEEDLEETSAQSPDQQQEDATEVRLSEGNLSREKMGLVFFMIAK